MMNSQLVVGQNLGCQLSSMAFPAGKGEFQVQENTGSRSIAVGFILLNLLAL